MPHLRRWIGALHAIQRLGDEATIRSARACLGAAALPAAVEALLGARADGVMKDAYDT